MMTSQRPETRVEPTPRRAKRPHRVTTDTGIHILLAHYSRTGISASRDAIIAYYQKLVRSLAARFLSGRRAAG